MSAGNEFRPLDLVEDSQGELFVVDQKKLGNTGLYGAISLARPQMGILTISDKHDRRLASVEELPKAVRALLLAKKALSRGPDSAVMGTYLGTIIRVIDELQGILDPENSE